jgi:hypothetical protein
MRQLLFAAAAVALFGSPLRLFAGISTQTASAADASRGIVDNAAVEHPLLLDNDDDDEKHAPSPAPTSASASGRYFFDLLDHRSSYGNDFFHDPFIGPEFDSERQIELDYLHGERRGSRDDEIDAGFQWNIFGQTTIAGEFGWDSEHQPALHGGADGGDGQDNQNQNSSGLENVDLAIYHPLFQYVSRDNVLDYTAAARLDLGIPTRTPVSGTDAQLTPFLGHMLRIGEHLSLEAWTAVQFTIAPHQTNQLIYGVSLGYQLFHEQLPLPFTEKITPIVELDGQSPLSSQGQDALFGVAGVDVTFTPVAKIDPHIELGYQFPLDQGAREQLQWGIIAEVFLEF